MAKNTSFLLKIDKWDSHFFKKKIARLEILGRKVYPGFSEALSDLLKTAGEKKVAYMVIKLFNPRRVYEQEIIRSGFKECGQSVDLKFVLRPVAKRIQAYTHYIRPAKRADILAIREIARDAFRLSYLYKAGFARRSEVNRYHMAWAENLIKDKEVEVLVAERKGRVLGFITLGINMRKREARINLIAVDKKFRGLGIGSQLVEKCIESARGRLKAIFVKTQKQNQAVSLYKKIGFVIYSYDKIFCKRLI